MFTAMKKNGTIPQIVILRNLAFECTNRYPLLLFARSSKPASILTGEQKARHAMTINFDTWMNAAKGPRCADEVDTFFDGDIQSSLSVTTTHFERTNLVRYICEFELQNFGKTPIKKLPL